MPARWRPLFQDREALLEGHRGWDAGALPLARALARALEAPLLVARTTRLLADPNRSEGNPALFSEVTRALPGSERARLIASVWRPHRAAVEARARALLTRHGAVVHVGVHSFTPVLDGRRRDADVGLLYDPGRAAEGALAARWRARLRDASPTLRVRRNYPYRGVSDGLTTALRARLGPHYVGLELEVGQEVLGGSGRAAVTRALAESLARALEG